MVWAAAYRFMMGSNKLQETGSQKNLRKYAQKIPMVYFLLTFISLIFDLQATSLKHKYPLQYVDGSPINKHIAQGHPIARILDFVGFLIVN